MKTYKLSLILIFTLIMHAGFLQKQNYGQNFPAFDETKAGVAETKKPAIPVDGYAAIKKHIEYPELARKVGLEGNVVIGVLIDERGNPIKTKVRKAARFRGFVKAAEKAVLAVKWKPARQGDRAIKMWVWVPVHFVKWE